ncbi:hypothetical protein ACFSC3_04370 [Sphingomonas floccifaciens]|uniref:Glycerophosphoryl diester phosphodiesterase membrane domain-containing protein n=1 Tax=Sphingomonas floccifaciens TaxID=1844115 RepID=A0ABW4NAE9_9SPHN
MSYSDRAPPLAIGTVMGRAFGVMTGNPMTVFAIAFLLGAVPQQVMSQLLMVRIGPDAAAQSGFVALMVLNFIVYAICTALALAALVRTTGAFVQGRTIGLGESLSGGLVKLLPLIGVAILYTIGIAVGWVFLIVPGIIVLVTWIVTIPALVEEDRGVFAAFGRSRELTRGVRWTIFFLVVIVLILSWLASALGAVPTVILNGGLTGLKPTPVTVVTALITSTLTTALWSTVVTSLFFTLREAREGPQTEQLADVFA